PEAEHGLGVAGVDRGGEAVTVAVGQLDRLVEVAERVHTDDRSEGLGAVQLVLGGDAVDDGGVAVEPGLRVADEPRPRVVPGDPAEPGRAAGAVVAFDQAGAALAPFQGAL